MPRKTWAEKLENGKRPTVGPSVRKAWGRPIGTIMLVPTPRQVDDYIRAIPRGEERTLEQMSDELAKANGAEIVCPMCCGMFVRISAEAAYEALIQGADLNSITPFWRMAGPKAALRKKVSFGTELIDKMRTAEGLA